MWESVPTSVSMSCLSPWLLSQTEGLEYLLHHLLALGPQASDLMSQLPQQ
jgi:hypothetical protein